MIDALLRNAGILRFTSGEELFNAAEFFEGQPLPGGRRVGIVSNSTGVATLAADGCMTRGLVVGELDEPHGTRWCSASTPVPRRTPKGIRSMLEDAGVDAVIACYVDLVGGDPRDGPRGDRRRGERDSRSPSVASVVTADGRLPADGPTGLPNFLFPGVLCRRAGAGRRAARLALPTGGPAAQVTTTSIRGGRRAARGATASGRHELARHRGRRRPAGDPRHRDRRVAALRRRRSAGRRGGAHRGADRVEGRLPAPAHAGDIDAVLLGLAGEEAVRAGWSELERRVQAAGRSWTGAIVQPLVGAGADVLVGAVRDPDFGPVMAIGLGGRQAGLARTVAFRMLPVTGEEADELIDASESVATQLDGFRGSPRVDRPALRDLMLRFAQLLRGSPEIAEADLNPVRCMPKGCVVLDLRMRIERQRPSERVKTW